MRFKNQPWDDKELLPLQKMARYHNLSARHFGKMFHVSHNTAIRILNGDLPKLATAIQIARVFRCAVEDIWGKQVPEITDN